MNQGKIELLKWTLVSLAIPISAGVHGHFQAQAVRDAEMARQDADLLLKLLPELNSTKAEEVEMARRIVFGLEHTASASPAVRSMASHLRDLEVQSRSAGRLREAALISEAEAQADPSIVPVEPLTIPPSTSRVRTSAVTSLTRVPSRVFIQIYDEEQRGQANAVREVLRARGVAVPGIENVLKDARDPSTVRRFAQRGSIAVRYFNDGDEAVAEAVATQIASSAGVTRIGVQRVRQSAVSVPAGQLEIWFAIPDGAE